MTQCQIRDRSMYKIFFQKCKILGKSSLMWQWRENQPWSYLSCNRIMSNILLYNRIKDIRTTEVFPWYIISERFSDKRNDRMAMINRHGYISMEYVVSWQCIKMKRKLAGIAMELFKGANTWDNNTWNNEFRASHTKNTLQTMQT